MAVSYCQGKGAIRRGIFAALALMIWCIAPVRAQMPPAPGVPNFWDPQRRVEKPDTSFLQVIRFITDDEYPPFGFTTPEGTLSGFNVDLARAICKELEVTCTVQRRRFDTIASAIEKGEADAAAASMAITAKAREKLLFTHPYYRTPARFAALKGQEPKSFDAAGLKNTTIGVVEKTAHAAFLAKFFPAAALQPYADLPSLLRALKERKIDILFGDGVTLAIWLNSADGECCTFAGGPYTESAYFGEGVGIAVNKKNPALRRAIDWALAQLAEKGIYSELYLKYFPIGFY
ncbi:MAG: transporter substrate-binding domain-containing protein [Beijerinckiaceae bacterium]